MQLLKCRIKYIYIYNPCENTHVHVTLITLTFKSLDFEINFESESTFH